MPVRIKNTSDTALIFKRVFTLTITIWVMLDLACVAGGILVFLGKIFFFTFAPPPPPPPHHFSNGPSLRHIACEYRL